jgi:tetratricopeptide (TPR) repeat protein
VIASLASLQARLHALKGDAPRAEAFLREALILRLKDLAPDDPEVLSTMLEMVRIVSPQSSSPLGNTIREIWGPDPATISAHLRHDVQILASADRNTFNHVVRTGRPAALGRILQLQEHLFGPDHPSLLQTLTAQVRAATSEREPEVRIAAAQRTYQIVSRRFGLHDFTVLVCVQDVAAVLAYCGRTSEAVPLARQAVAILEAVPDRARDAALYANAQRLLSWFLAMDKQYPDAAKEYRKAIALAQGGDVPAHILAGAEAGLAYCEAMLGEVEHAMELSERALKRATDSPATPADQLANIQFARALVLLRAKQNDLAKPLLAKAWVIYEFAGVDMPWRRRLIEEMQTLCQTEGDTSGLERWTREMNHEPSMDNLEEIP